MLTQDKPNLLSKNYIFITKANIYCFLRKLVLLFIVFFQNTNNLEDLQTKHDANNNDFKHNTKAAINITEYSN